MEVEICCGSIQSAFNAQRGGATRIELCQNLNEGGTTPSYGSINQCVDAGLQTFVLIRPRPGNFVYNNLEIENMLADVRVCKQLGVAGIVVGFLHPDGRVDTVLTRRFVAEADPIPVTFHRAFDRCNDWKQALEDVIACGCKRILTSGCQPTALEGKDSLKELIQRAGTRITILVGGSVRPDNAEQIIQHTGAQEIHSSCKITLADGYDETDEASVQELLSRCL